MSNIDEKLIELEAVRKKLLEEKAMEEAEVVPQQEEQREEPRVLIQAYLAPGGPVVNIQGDLVSAYGLLTYMEEYVKMIMQRHIVNAANSSAPQAEEQPDNESN
jgi:hypothetical protein